MIVSDELYQKICELTNIDYDVFAMDKEKERVMLSSDVIKDMLEDLCIKVDELQEHIEDINEEHKAEIENNYVPRHIDPYEEFGVSRNDFVMGR